jgi:hypothetical protein
MPTCTAPQIPAAAQGKCCPWSAGILGVVEPAPLYAIDWRQPPTVRRPEADRRAPVMIRAWTAEGWSCGSVARAIPAAWLDARPSVQVVAHGPGPVSRLAEADHAVRGPRPGLPTGAGVRQRVTAGVQRPSRPTASAAPAAAGVRPARATPQRPDSRVGVGEAAEKKRRWRALSPPAEKLVAGGTGVSGGCSNHVADIRRAGRIGVHHVF